MLYNLALKAMKNAYAPYSNFKVGVAIRSSKSKFYVGCNVENAAYPQSLCAESGAIASMVAEGCNLISEVLIISDSDKLIVPCGGCRQKLLEFSNEDTKVHLASISRVEKTLSIHELLPFSFDNTFLNDRSD